MLCSRRGTAILAFVGGVGQEPSKGRGSALNTPVRRRQIDNIVVEFVAPEVMMAGISEMWSVLIASTLAGLLVLLALRWGLQKWIDSVYKN